MAPGGDGVYRARGIPSIFDHHRSDRRWVSALSARVKSLVAVSGVLALALAGCTSYTPPAPTPSGALPPPAAPSFDPVAAEACNKVDLSAFSAILGTMVDNRPDPSQKSGDTTMVS